MRFPEIVDRIEEKAREKRKKTGSKHAVRLRSETGSSGGRSSVTDAEQTAKR